MKTFLATVSLFEVLCVWAAALVTYVVIFDRSNWQTQTLVIVNLAVSLFGRVRGQLPGQ